MKKIHCDLVPIETYESAFANLHVKITDGRKMPNKAIMLLSVMELIRCRYITLNKIYLNQTIKYAFEYEWALYVGGMAPCVWIPFWHMKNEKFWHFKPINSQSEIDTLVKAGQTAPFRKMTTAIKYAYFDADLFEYMKTTESRTRLFRILSRFL